MKCRTLPMGTSWKSPDSMKNCPRWRNLRWAKASQSHRTCVADSCASRHLSQMGSFINHILKRCPFRWQCPVYSLTIHLSWSLFRVNRSLVLLAEGPGISSFDCLSPVMDSHCLVCFLFNQLLTAFYYLTKSLVTYVSSLKYFSEPTAYEIRCNIILSFTPSSCKLPFIVPPVRLISPILK
jgi:hypothetical protein